MSANGNGSRVLNLLRAALKDSRPWAWLAAVVTAATAAAYLTAAASPLPSRHTGGSDTGAATQFLSCGL